MTTKRRNPIDAQVGSRVRLRRALQGISQERLGELLGVTFQQVQKYEKGINRIGAGRLYQIALILDVPVGYFYEDVAGARFVARGRKAASPSPLLEFLSSAEGVRLTHAFMRLKGTRVRKCLIDLIKSMSEGEQGLATERKSVKR